jgi:putative transposase
MGVSEQTFYRWKKQYAGMGVGEIRRLKQLEEENPSADGLKQLVADLSLDKLMLQDVLSKKSKAELAAGTGAASRGPLRSE